MKGKNENADGSITYKLEVWAIVKMDMKLVVKRRNNCGSRFMVHD